MDWLKQLLATTSTRQRLIAGACVAGLLAAVTGIYSISPGDGNAPDPVATAASRRVTEAGVNKSLASGAMAAFVLNKQRPELPDVTFRDEVGAQRDLSEWRGRVVLLNLWATWCAPCRKEMPDLAELEQTLGGDDFEVIAVSVDRKGAEASAQFLIENNAAALKLYIDRSAGVLDQVKAIGLPTSLLIDRTGKVIGRLTGPADWASPEAVTLIKAALAEGRPAQPATN